MKKAASILALLAIVFGIAAFQCSSTEITSAKLYIQQKSLDKAKEVLISEVEKNSKSVEGFYLLGYVYGEEGDMVNMIKNYDKSVAAGPDFAQNIDDSKKYHWQDQFNKGVGLFNRATKTSSEDTSKMYIDKSIKSFQNAILCQPDSADTYRNLTFSFLNAGREDEAVEPLEKIISLTNSADSYTMLGEIYYNKGISLMNNFIENNTVEDSVKAMEYYDMTIELLEEGRKNHPDDSEMLLILSNSYVNADKLDVAMSTFEEGVKNDPENKYYRYNYGVLLLGANNYEDAATQFGKAIEIDSEYTNAQYNLGVAYVKWGSKIQEEAIKNDDESTVYKETFELALPPLKSYLELNAEDSKVWELLGKVYANLGLSAESKEAFEKADLYR